MAFNRHFLASKFMTRNDEKTFKSHQNILPNSSHNKNITLLNKIYKYVASNVDLNEYNFLKFQIFFNFGLPFY